MAGTALSLCLASGWTNSFVFRCLPAWMPGTVLWGGRVHLSPFVSLHLPPVLSQPGCLARLSGWTGSFVSLCVASGWTNSFVFRCLPAYGGRIHLSFFLSISFTLPPGLDAWHGRVHLSPCVSLSNSFVLGCCPAWMIWHGSPCGQLHLSRFVPSFVSHRLRGFICLPLADGFIFLPVCGLICLPLSPICLLLFPNPMPLPCSTRARHQAGRQWETKVFCRLSAHTGSSLVSLHVSPVLSQPGCLARLSEWTGSFVCLCLASGWTDAFVSLLVVSQPGCLARFCGWTDSFVSFVSLYLFPAVTGSCAAGRHVCLRLRNACLSAGSRLRMHA